MTDISKECREAFEEWAKSNRLDVWQDYGVIENYSDPQTQAAWLAWQAREDDVQQLRARIAELEACKFALFAHADCAGGEYLEQLTNWSNFKSTKKMQENWHEKDRTTFVFCHAIDAAREGK